MYSDSDFDAYDEYDVAESSDYANAMEELEIQIQERDKILTTQARSYAWIFEAEDGFFCSRFASLLASRQKHKDWWNSPASPDCSHTVAALLNTEKSMNAAANGDGHAGVKQVKTEGESVTATIPALTQQQEHQKNQPTEPGAAATKTRAVGLQPSGVYILSSSEGKPSPASRFLCDHFSQCILFPVDKTLNRANLRAAHKDMFAGLAGIGGDGLDIVPGYKHTEPSGWALPLSTDADVLTKIKAHYPGWRAPTAADVRLFTKPESSSDRDGAGANAQQPAPSSRSWTRNAAKLMSSKKRFLA